ncbi:MAG: family 43 glycosylhydrolase [Clostridia bacterium]|nr:family 43 glycosylhydrolase [Clostridia bacterium]
MEMTFTNPVAPGADPFVLKDDDGTYYLYATSGEEYGYRVYSSKNLVEWTAHGYCLVRDDVYTDPKSSFTTYSFWAPEVIKYDGLYYMVYTAQHRIGIAVSESPTGPFKNDADGYLLDSVNASYWGIIDGNFFLDDDGKMYLYFVTQRAARFGKYAVKQGNNIWGCEFDMETLSVKADTIKLLVQWSATFDQTSTGGDCVEGSFMIKDGDTYYITFSANRYYSTKYSVQYATSDAPLGNFDRKYNNITLMCDDLNRKDTQNPHLYGTGHHSFVEAPNGKDLLIIYHAHRAASSYVYTESADLVSPRSVCVDLAWFTEDGKLVAGSKENPTVPTATAQSVLEGTSLARETHFDGAFEAIPTLPTVYVAQKDGLDTNAGTKTAPFKTLEKALLTLKNGGTVVLTQGYSAGALLNVPKCSGPIRITAEHNNVILTYKFIKLNTDVYFDTIIFAPETVNEISVIEGNFHNVVMGEGVSCLNRPLTRDYPYLVGGKWQYTGSDKSAVYNSFMPSDSKLSSAESYNLTVLGGTWEAVFAGSVKQYAPVDGSAPNGVLTVGENVRVLRGASAAVEVKMTVGSTTAYVNGIAKTLDAAPVIQNSRTMLPVRFVAESFDAKVEWDGKTSTAIITNADTTIEITVGASVAKINGADTKLDAPAYIDPASNRTYLPVRFVAEALGAKVSWDGETSTATLAK